MNFKIEQIAIAPVQPGRAINLLQKLGMTDWAGDVVVAAGTVFGVPAENTANLSFNYQADRNFDRSGDPKNLGSSLPVEFEVLDYVEGDNWVAHAVGNAPIVSHLGMHVTEAELAKFHEIFVSEDIVIAQEVFTKSHTNPHIANSRRYHYRIYNTRPILGVDLKFIVRMPLEA